MRWIERLEQAAPGWDGPTVWTFRGSSGVALAPYPEDLAHAERRRHPERRIATLDRRLALRALAARVLGVDPADVQASQLPDGGPCVVAPRPLHASAASRDGLTVLAVSPHPVGVDVERVDPEGVLPLDLLHPALAARLATANDGESAATWAGVEACLKLTGVGLEGLSRVSLAEGVAARQGDPRRMALAFQRIGNAVVAVATFAI